MDEVFYFHGNWIFCSFFIYSIHFRMHAITFVDSILTISLFANFQYILFVLLCNIRSLTWLSLLQSLSDAYHHFSKRFFHKQDALLSFAHRHSLIVIVIIIIHANNKWHRRRHRLFFPRFIHGMLMCLPLPIECSLKSMNLVTGFYAITQTN